MARVDNGLASYDDVAGAYKYIYAEFGVEPYVFVGGLNGRSVCYDSRFKGRKRVSCDEGFIILRKQLRDIIGEDFEKRASSSVSSVSS